METQHRLKFLTSVISCGMAPMWNALFVRKGKVKREEKRCVKKKKKCLWPNYNNNKLFIIIIFNNLIVINFGRENLTLVLIIKKNR